MSNVDEKIKNALTEFSEELGNKKFFDSEDIEEIPAEEIRAQFEKKEYWGPWCKSSGIYYFLNETEILYIGRALFDTSFGNRIDYHIRENKAKWKDAEVVGFISVKKNYMAAALEIYLTEKLDPKHSGRLG